MLQQRTANDLGSHHRDGRRSSKHVSPSNRKGGEADEDGSRIPCREGDDWCPIIDLATGTVAGWPKGTTADIHYKVCDDGRYTLRDADNCDVKQIDGYVPKIMCPADNGYGDYVIMKIDGDGKIADWVVDLDAFEKEDA